MTVISIGSNFYKYGFTEEAVGRTIIDVAAFALTALAVTAIPGVGGVVAGMFIGALADLSKNYLFGDG